MDNNMQWLNMLCTLYSEATEDHINIIQIQKDVEQLKILSADPGFKIFAIESNIALLLLQYEETSEFDKIKKEYGFVTETEITTQDVRDIIYERSSGKGYTQETKSNAKLTVKLLSEYHKELLQASYLLNGAKGNEVNSAFTWEIIFKNPLQAPKVLEILKKFGCVSDKNDWLLTPPTINMAALCVVLERKGYLKSLHYNQKAEAFNKIFNSDFDTDKLLGSKNRNQADNSFLLEQFEKIIPDIK